MKATLFISLFVSFLSGACATTGTIGCPSAVPEQRAVTESVVALSVQDDKKEWKVFCSGVVVQTVPVTYILTEAHCLDANTPLATVRVEGQTLVEVARKADVVLLRVQGWLAKSAPLLVAETAPVMGDRVRATGWAFGTSVMQTSGTMAGTYEDELYLDMQCVKGMSGGPVINADGNMVSLVRAFQTDGVGFVPSPNGFSVGPSTGPIRDLVALMRSLHAP
jgi:S1-C subfamily serine protease